MQKKSITGTVTEILPSLMGSKGTALSVIANSLGLHPKKLQRLLKDEGTSYQDILDDVRKSQAARLLEDTDMSIAKIAQFMDYSSDRPMNIAFKRWYNQSPQTYRKAKTATGGFVKGKQVIANDEVTKARLGRLVKGKN